MADDKYDKDKNKQTTKPGPVEAHSEFRDDAIRMFPKEFGEGIEQESEFRVPRGAYWAFAAGTLGLMLGAAWTLFAWQKRANAPRPPEKVVH